MQYAVEFTTPVTVREGREWARKILDAIHLQVTLDAPPELDEASFKCAELKRLLKIEIVEPEAQ